MMKVATVGTAGKRESALIPPSALALEWQGCAQVPQIFNVVSTTNAPCAPQMMVYVCKQASAEVQQLQASVMELLIFVVVLHRSDKSTILCWWKTKVLCAQMEHNGMRDCSFVHLTLWCTDPSHWPWLIIVAMF